MADSDITVAAPSVSDTTSGAGAAAGPPPRRRVRVHAAWGMLPFFLLMTVFFILPTLILLYTAFQPASGSGFTMDNVSTSLQGAYRTGLINSVKVSLIDAILAGILGLFLAQAIVSSRSRILKELSATAAAVLTNFGGLPLAFLFVAAIGNAGVVTKLLDDHLGISLSDMGFNLYGISGVVVVYLYFLVPLMVLVIIPSLEGLRPQWREAALNLGANRWQYWRHVATPVLLPSFLGALALLFCSAISAYATAAALTNGTLALTPLQIAAVLSGNVLADQANVGAALALDLMVLIVPLTALYLFLQRRTARWLQ
ncbi:ABC transporter permease subunit [Branchiibius sp. NY16-3462-2]|uniref:ABC transporter permease n=1 Tax=Branchiibius sp. NY16-3462-2 TaxID=1807500 RepID=UPI0025B9C351|nr:ABC transporter permease subunit [Branchiibius sp. NY16-3462-2]